MNRRSQIIFAGLAFLVLEAVAARIAGLQAPNRSCGVTRPVTDMASRKTAVPVDPRRVLSLCTSATDTIIRIGAGERLVAIDQYSAIVPGTDAAVRIGKEGAISRERVIALGVDLAFLWWYQDDAAQVLEELSVPTVRIRSGRAAEVPEMIRLVGDCVGCTEAARRLANQVADSRRAARKRSASPRPSVYFEMYGPFRTVGRGSYADDLIELAGGRNVAAAACGSVILSPEELIHADPDVILFVNEFTTADAIGRRNGMQGLSAVRAGRVYPVSRYWFVAGAGLPEAVEKIGAALQKSG